jgi:hypothetical protein
MLTIQQGLSSVTCPNIYHSKDIIQILSYMSFSLLLMSSLALHYITFGIYSSIRTIQGLDFTLITVV